MHTRRRISFTSIQTEGAILPPDLLERVQEGDSELGGLQPGDYHLQPGEKLNEVISRSWNRMIGTWVSFRAVSIRVPQDDPGTTITRERWLLPLFQELGYGRLLTARAIDLNGKNYPISHAWGQVPIHLVGSNISLDRRTVGVAGAARTSPHSLVQELLNRSDDHLWAFLSNGLSLRILRDNASLTRQAYVEFDLETMMEGEAYADFVLLWLLCHQSRVEADRPEEFWLECWSQTAQEQGTRALEQLREGVEKAIRIFGEGFLAHPGNYTLKERLREGDLDQQDYYRQLMRLVYRLIFLFVAEDRGLLFDPASRPAARERYREYYSTARLRRLAERRRGTRHPDLYRGLWVVMEKLGSEEGCPELGVPGLGGFLWSEEAISDLAECQLANHDLLDIVRSLAFTTEGRVRRAVDYKNLGPEELGSVYESLLELQPEMNVDAPTFELKVVGGSERKTTGSYYTPTSLIQCLLDSALDPVIEEALKEDDPEEALLNLKICDPATGSGHFLVAAAHRVARSLASVRTGDAEPSPEAQRTAVRDVIGRCVYGVDINPMAVELCKVNLWLEALDPGKPLTFLDDQILCGNSLLGTTPALMEGGIPDDAFKPIEGDDKKFASSLKKQNKQERSGQLSMFAEFEREERVNYALLQKEAIGIAETDDRSVRVVREKGEKYRALMESEAYRHSKLLADAWCTTFVWHKTAEAPEPITEASYRKLVGNPNSISAATKKEIERLSEQYQFFHWHLAFPGVFWLPEGEDEPENEQMGWSGGFDVMLGNPPWEKLKLMEVEFFAARAPEIAEATTQAKRHKMIDRLRNSMPDLIREWQEAVTRINRSNLFIRSSSRFSYTAVGELNTYALFSELALNLCRPLGRCGIIVKSSLITAGTYGTFFQHLAHKHLVSAYDFKNWALYFADVGFHERYTLLTLERSRRQIDGIRIGVELVKVEELTDPDKTYSITTDELSLFNPLNGTCPLFRNKGEKEIARHIYERFSVLVPSETDDNPWRLKYVRLFDMSGASDLFHTKGELVRKGGTLEAGSFHMGSDVFEPLYEGKYIQIFNHRFASYEGIAEEARFTRKAATTAPTLEQLQDPFYEIEPRYWIQQSKLIEALESRISVRDYYVLARLVTNVISNNRTTIACVAPAVACNNLALILYLDEPDRKTYGAKCLLFAGLLNSFAFDFVTRLKLSENLLKSTLFEVAAPGPEVFWTPFLEGTFETFVLSRAAELSCVTRSLSAPLSDIGLDCPPFRWDEERRFLLRCELDDAFFHLYLPATPDGRWRPARVADGDVLDESDDEMAELEKYFPTPRHAVDYILDTFPIVHRRDQAEYGEYRTKRVILEIYDEMQRAIATGEPYQTHLDPPPADPRVAHGG